MEDTRATLIKESISNLRLSLLFKIIGNILLALTKIILIPIIALCFFVSIGLNLIGKPLFTIISLLGSCAILWSLWEIFSGKYPADKFYTELAITASIAVMLGGLLLAIEYIPKAFESIAGLFIALFPVWFK